MKTLPSILCLVLTFGAVAPSRATVPSTTSRTDLVGNGSITAFTLKTYDKVDVDVFVNRTKQSSGYATVLDANQDTTPGGTVTILSVPASAATVRIQRTVSLTQGMSLTQSSYRAKTIEKPHDQEMMGLQQLGRQISDHVATVNAIAAAANGDTPVTAAGSTTARPLNDRFADVVSVRDVGAVGNGVTDDTAALQRALDAAAAKGMDLFVARGTYLLSSQVTVPTTFHGRVYGPGVLAAKPATTIGRLVDMTNASRVQWEVSLDMGQTSATAAGDPRCQMGLYLFDARDIDIVGVNVSNVRVGRQIFIDGTSSTAPIASNGSQRIRVTRMTSVAFAYNTVDEGAYPVVRSSYYTDTAGGTYFAASNGVKVSDYTVDEAVSYPATTKDIWFTDCHFENGDRFAVLNATSIHLTNVNLINVYTRGYNISPTGTYITIKGGRITGGSASQIAFAYACKHVTVDGVMVDSIGGSIGEKTTLKTYFGCEDISFSNISGVAGANRAIYVHSSKRIHFNNINLRKFVSPGSTVAAISVSAGPDGNASSYQTSDISVVDSSFQSSYALYVHQFGAGGTATMGVGALRVSGCSFDKSLQFFGGTPPTAGEVELLDSRATVSGSSQDLSSASFKTFRGNNLQVKMTDQVTLAGATTYPSFASVRYYVPERDGGSGDAARNPAVDVWRTRAGVTTALFYGVHWVVDTSADGTMWDRIRMYDAGSSTAAGDIITIRRRE